VRKNAEARIVKIAGSRIRASVGRCIVVACLAVVTMSGAVAVPVTCADTNFGAPAQRWFRLEWTVSAEPRGPRRIIGWLYNDYGTSAGDVRLLVEALDKSETIIERRYQWVPGSLPPLSRTYFEVRRLPAADSYRVTVHSFNIHESIGWF
jgi:hypothetical protein